MPLDFSSWARDEYRVHFKVRRGGKVVLTRDRSLKL
jgi:hypothetical protein